MKNISKAFLVMAVTFLFTSCGQGHHSAMEAESSADSAMVSSAVAETPNGNGRKFIKTSELKFKVKNVADATYKIEDITLKEGGFITKSDLSSSIDHVETIKISADSLLETKYYTVANEMIIRVPTQKLDTTLKQIAKLVDFLDYRIIKADDVGLALLSNEMTQKRVSKNEQRLASAIDNKGNKLSDINNSEDNLLNRAEQVDNAKLSTLSLNDQINFSTVSLSVYERQTTKSEMIANSVNIKEYQQGFFRDALDAFAAGYEILLAILLFLIRIWGVLVLGITAWIIYRKYGMRFRKEA